MPHKVRYDIEGLDCPTCAVEIEKDIKNLKGVQNADLNFIHKKIDIEYSNTIYTENALNKIVKKHKKQVELHDESNHNKEESHVPYTIPIRVSISISLVILNYFFITSPIYSIILYSLSYLLSGYDVLLNAGKNIIKGKFFDEQFLMSIATIGAFIIQKFPEATAVMAFYQIGEYFQTRAVDHSRRSIKSLINLKPNFAHVKYGSTIKKIKVENVHVDDSIVIKPGENIPVDILITAGISQLDTSAISGESKPLTVSKGSKVLSGSVNGNGFLEGKALTDYKNSTVSRLLHLVEDAGLRKAKTENFIKKFSRYYTPTVVFSALFVAFVVPFITSSPFQPWIYRALVFLVVSCPCALVLSVPLGIFAGIGHLAHTGILVKGGNYLEAMSKVDSIVFDKTGTITTGDLHVQSFSVDKTSTYSLEEISYYAASLETYTNHVIASPIVSYYKGDLSENVHEIVEYTGKGISGFVDNKKVSITNHLYIDENGIRHDHELYAETDSQLFVSIEDSLVATITLTDTVKIEAEHVVNELRERGVKNIILLSGDSKEAVESVANEVGIPSNYFRKLPHEKLDVVEGLISVKQSGKHVVFIGDGINDAPVLRVSDVGISMGTMGSDAAIESSDIVIMNDNLEKLVYLIDTSKRTMSIIRQNIIFAISIKILVMVMSILSLSTLWMAVFADSGVALLAVANSLRILARNGKQKIL